MERHLSILHQYWGYSSFRGIQSEIIASVAAGHDTLGLMPTGGGKSITFQVPALAMEGVCIVVTPLIALMKDQVDNLRSRGIQATAVHVGQPHKEMLRRLDNCILGITKFLYVSPERLETEMFLDKAGRMKVCLLTVDEAHCISQWGYDFRPAYLRIRELRKRLPGVPVLALTATATPTVAHDIEKRLRRPDIAEDAKDYGFRRFTMSFARPNLRYVVRPTEDVVGEIDHILHSVPGPAIVYTRSRNGAQELAAKLVAAGHEAVYYHAGLTPLDKDTRQRMWTEEDYRVIVATNAFGMGIDKPNVRIVIHADLPDSIEAYFQEAGRAGRDGKTAYAVCLSQRSDRLTLTRRLADEYPDAGYIRQVYENLASFFQLAVGDGLDVTYEFDIPRFCRAFRMYPTTVTGALHILTQAGYIHFREEDTDRSRLLFIIGREELYRLHRLPPQAERTIQAVLRTTSGVFSEYSAIHENDLAESAGTTAHEVYETLKALTHQRVLNYIPRKHTPRITFLRRRVDTSRLQIPPAVLDQRRQAAKQRMEAMLQYTLDTTRCHSQYLLSYFGENTSQPCGHCDACLSHKRGNWHKQFSALLLRTLREKGPQRPEALHLPGYDTATLRRALTLLMQEETVILENGKLRLNNSH